MKRHYVRLLLVVLIAIAVASLLSEGALRLIGYTYTPLRIELLGKQDWRVYHAFEDSHFIYDPHLFWRPKSSDPSFNTQGYRGRELDLKKRPGSVRLFAVGDSNTLGWAGQNGSNWPSELEALLRHDDDSFTVTNAGAWGYSSFQGLRRFKEALTWQPDIVLVSFGANDGHRVVTSDTVYARRGLRGLHLDKLIHNLRLGQLLLQAWDLVSRRPRDAPVPRVAVDDYEANLTAIVRLATERGIQVVLLTRPFVHEPPGLPHYPPTDIYNARTKQLGERLGVSVIDLYAYFDGQAEYFTDSYHFNEEGNRLAAEILYEHLHAMPSFAGLAPVIGHQHARIPRGPLDLRMNPAHRILPFSLNRAALSPANARLGLTAKVNKSTFEVGQTLTTSASVSNAGFPGSADLYFGALLPDGATIVFWTGGSTTVVGRRGDLRTFRPYSANVSLTTPFFRDMSDFFSYQWTGREAQGNYVIFNLVTKAGALAAGVTNNDAILGLETATFSFR